MKNGGSRGGGGKWWHETKKKLAHLHSRRSHKMSEKLSKSHRAANELRRRQGEVHRQRRGKGVGSVDEAGCR